MKKRPQRTLFLDVCFECGQPKSHEHHVIPQVLGGTQTVPLCEECHGKIHEADLKITELTRVGINKVRQEEGIHWGAPPRGKRYSKRLDERGYRIIEDDEITQRIIAIMKDLKEQGKTYQEIAAFLNEYNHKTSRIKQWKASTVGSWLRGGK